MNRDHIMSVRLTAAERATLQLRANAAGCTPSELVRRWLRGTVATPIVLDTYTTSIVPGHVAIWPPTANPHFGVSVTWPDGTVGGTCITSGVAA